MDHRPPIFTTLVFFNLCVACINAWGHCVPGMVASLLGAFGFLLSLFALSIKRNAQ
jgi:hypothetical protein